MNFNRSYLNLVLNNDIVIHANIIIGICDRTTKGFLAFFSNKKSLVSLRPFEISIVTIYFFK